jgi:hypothetical protein
MGGAHIPPPVFNRGDEALYIGPLRSNAHGRWARRGLCRIVSTPHDAEHRTGLCFVITFQPPPASRRTEFRAFLSELLPVTRASAIPERARAAG